MDRYKQALSEVVSINPPFFEGPISEITKYYESRRWFELGKTLLNLLKQPGIVGERMNFYTKFVTVFADYLDPIHHAQIIQLVSEDLTSPTAALEFISERLGKFDKFPDAKDWLTLQIINAHTVNGEFEVAMKMLCDVEKGITESSSMIVRSLYYKTITALDKARGDYDSFYEHALLFLSTSKQYNDVVLAYDLCMSALISKDVCSFGELAAHPVLQSLYKGENEWMANLICLLDNGSPTIIDEFNDKYLPIIKKRPQFIQYIEVVKFKVTISVLLQLIFQRPFESRVFTFDEICQVCKIPKNQVEIVVLKALAAKIIQGFINEVDERIIVTWCKPKALGIVRLQHLKDQIDRWIKRVHEQRILLELKSQAVVG